MPCCIDRTKAALSFQTVKAPKEEVSGTYLVASSHRTSDWKDLASSILTRPNQQRRPDNGQWGVGQQMRRSKPWCHLFYVYVCWRSAKFVSALRNRHAGAGRRRR